MLVSGLGGGLLILAGLIAAPSLTDGNLASQGLAWVVGQRFGSVLGRLLLCTVAVAVFACTLACQTAGSRMVYSMARENALPVSKLLSRVSSQDRDTGRGEPGRRRRRRRRPAGQHRPDRPVHGAVQPLHRHALPRLPRRHRTAAVPAPHRLDRRAGPTDLDEDGRPVFTLGRWGVALNAVAVLYQVCMVVNLLWPRTAVYDTTGHTWWLRWSAVLFIAATTAVGARLLRLRPPPAPRIRRGSPERRRSRLKGWPSEKSSDRRSRGHRFRARGQDARAQGGGTRRGDALRSRHATSPHVPDGVPAEALTWAETVAPGGYTHRVVARGTRIRLDDPTGEACAHLFLLRADAPHERLNVADTVKIPWQAYLGAGHPLLSGDGRVLATIAADTSARHDAFCGTSSDAWNTAKFGDARAERPDAVRTEPAHARGREARPDLARPRPGHLALPGRPRRRRRRPVLAGLGRRRAPPSNWSPNCR